MKKLLLAVCVAVLSFSAWAQDVIVCKDSKRIDAIITEVSLDEVKYKKQGNPNGPTFILPLSEVNTILYADGEVWTNQGQPSGTQAATTEPAQSRSANDNRQAADNTNNGGSKFKLQFNPTPTGDKHIFGITLGYTSKTMSASDSREKEEMPWLGVGENKKSTPGLLIGFTATPEFKYGIGIQTGLTYELYRAVEKYHDDEVTEKLSAMEHSITIPLRVQYRYEIIRDLSVFLYTGPAFEVAFGGVVKDQAGSETETDKLDGPDGMYSKNGGYNRFQMYWGFGGGVQWKYLQLRMGGDWGITDLRKKEYRDSGSTYTRNKPFSICLSYLF